MPEQPRTRRLLHPASRLGAQGRRCRARRGAGPAGARRGSPARPRRVDDGAAGRRSAPRPSCPTGSRSRPARRRGSPSTGPAGRSDPVPRPSRELCREPGGRAAAHHPPGVHRWRPHGRPGLVPVGLDRGQGEEERHLLLPGQRRDHRVAPHRPRHRRHRRLGTDAVATSAYLDVELKGGVRILATATLRDQPAGTWELQSGSEAALARTHAHARRSSPRATSSPDSGADSNVSDNCRWPISTPSWTR